MQEQSLGWEDPLKEGMATHSSIFFLLKRIHLFLIDWWLVYNIGLISVIHQHELTLGVHLSPPLESPLHLPPIPTPLGYYRAPVWVPWVIQQIPTGCLFTNVGVHASMLLSPFISPSPSCSPPLSVSLFSMSASPLQLCEQTSQTHPSQFHVFVFLTDFPV